MRSVFKRLNIREIKVKISTFSKASKNRDSQILYDLFLILKQRLHKRHKIDAESIAKNVNGIEIQTYACLIANVCDASEWHSSG